MTAHEVRSADGTVIAVESVGSGPALVCTVGAFSDRTSTRVLAAALADRFTVHAWDRRGRGASGGDPDPGGADSVRQEVEDLAAVVAHVGGAPALYGHSSGAILTLEAAMSGVPTARVVVYEPPWRDVDPAVRARQGEAMLTPLRAGRRGDAVEAFLTGGPGVPAAVVARMRASPAWAGLEALAPTLPRDVALAGVDGLPLARLAALDVPVLALSGERSTDWARASVAALAAAVPGAGHRELPGQEHAVDQTALAPVVADFLAGGTG